MYNQAILIGRLGADAEHSTTQSGQEVANFKMATGEKWIAKDGTPQERTEWHRVVVWGNQAKAVGNLRKGALVHVTGRIQSRSYEQDGQTKFITEIKAETVTFLEKLGERAADREQSFGADNARPQARQTFARRNAGAPDGMPF